MKFLYVWILQVAKYTALVRNNSSVYVQVDADIEEELYRAMQGGPMCGLPVLQPRSEVYIKATVQQAADECGAAVDDAFADVDFSAEAIQERQRLLIGEGKPASKLYQ